MVVSIALAQVGEKAHALVLCVAKCGSWQIQQQIIWTHSSWVRTNSSLSLDDKYKKTQLYTQITQVVVGLVYFFFSFRSVFCHTRMRKTKNTKAPTQQAHARTFTRTFGSRLKRLLRGLFCCCGGLHICVRVSLSLSLLLLLLWKRVFERRGGKNNKLKPSCVVRGKIFIMLVPLRESRLSYNCCVYTNSRLSWEAMPSYGRIIY